MARRQPAVVEVARELARAEAALAAGDEAAALGALLAAWGAAPDRELARAIEQLGVRAARGRSLPPPGPRARDRQRAWLTAARAGDPVTRQLLLDTLEEEIGEAREARLTALARFRDPRLTPYLIRAATARGTYRKLAHYRARWELLATFPDPRIADALPACEEIWGDVASWRVATTAIAKRIRAAAKRAPPCDDPAAIARILAAVAPAAPTAEDVATEAALLAAVYADPRADAPRAIYADWLQQRGDPRGELIALQLVAAQRALTADEDDRAGELLVAHRRRWLGPLAAAFPTAEFRRGFLARCVVDASDPAEVAAAALATPLWSTIESCNVLPGAGPYLALRDLDGVRPATLVRLAQVDPPPPLERLEVWWFDVTGKRLRDAIAAYTHTRLPHLRELEFHDEATWRTGDARWDPAQLAWCWTDRPALAQLELPGSPRHLAAWIRALAPTPIQKLVLAGDNWRCVLRRDDATGRLSRVAADGPESQFEANLAPILDGLDAVAPGAITRLVIKPRLPVTWLVRMRKRVAATLARHPKIDARIDGYVPPTA